MDNEELKNIILNNEELLIEADKGNDYKCAELLNSSNLLSKEIFNLNINESDLVNAFESFDEANEFLEKLEKESLSNSSIKRILYLLSEGKLNIGSKNVRDFFDSLSPSIISENELNKIKSLAERKTFVSADQISEIWLQWRPEGKVIFVNRNDENKGE